MRRLSYVGPASVVSACILLAACSGAAVRTSSVTQLQPGEAIDKSRGREISASANGFQLFAVIPIAINSRQSRAFEELRTKAGGDYLSNITVDESWTYAFVGTVHTTTMAAMAYPRSPMASTAARSVAPSALEEEASISLAEMCDLPSRVDQAYCLGQIGLGMTKSEVISELGQPDQSDTEGSLMKYGDRYLEFDSKSRLIGVTELAPR